MSNLKKFFVFILCFIMITLCAFTANAANTPKISVSTKTANPGESVIIDINISNNPGIMAMAFCIVYDSDSLTYEDYEMGYISSCTLKDHSDKGHISFVNIESRDKSDNGKIISLSFKVKANAKPGSHPIYIANSDRKNNGNKLHNIFSNSELDYIVPTAVSGGIKVLGTCQSTDHKYGDWNIIKDASCTESGLKNRICTICGYNDEVITTAPHDFENEWTIDKAATPDEDGEMSRHCKNCTATTDIITFCYEEIGGDGEADNTNSESSNDSTDSETSDNISSDDINSDKSSSVIDNSTTSQDSSSQPADNKKPSIDNVVGEKVPQQEAERFENYPQANKPEQDVNNTPEENSSIQETTSKDEPTKSDTNNQVDKNDDSFFGTPSGIIMIVVCSALSIGILVLGIILIIRNKKQ